MIERFVINNIILFPFKLLFCLRNIYNVIYSRYISNNIGKIGEKNFFVCVRMLKGGDNITIGNKNFFGYGLFITTWDSEFYKRPDLTIGDSCSFGAYNHLTCINRIVIGDNFLSGKWVTITDNSHGFTDYDSLTIRPDDRELVSKGPVIIGKNVWVGDKATILPGVTIGDGSIIAANAVVTHDIPPYSVAAGNPAKVIKQNNEIVNR